MAKIIFKNGRGRFEEKAPFPLGGDLTLELCNIPVVSAEFRFIAKTQGKEVFRAAVSSQNNVVTIPESVLSAGELVCVLIQYNAGQEAVRFCVEPLLLTDLDNTFEADPCITALERRVTACETVISALTAQNKALEESIKAEQTARKNACDALTQQQKTHEALIVSLLQFAYADYQASVYLDGDGWNAFCKKYRVHSFLLSDAAIKRIKGE